MNRRHLLLLMGVPVATWMAQRIFHSSPAPSLNITTFLSQHTPTDQYPRVTGPREFVFPEDHAAHPDYRHEWWYFTGNLADRTGRPFGFQLTFFRFALAKVDPESLSAWATRQAMLGHFAVTDLNSRRFHAFQRLGRPVLGISGMDHQPTSIWIRNWRATFAASAAESWILDAEHAGKKLALTVTPTKAPVLQGDQGHSRKGLAPGNASYYYSLTRLHARGHLELDGERFVVAGNAWLDREWGTSALASDLVGWDWFGLQLSDDSELTLYLLRRRDGSRTAFSAGSWNAPDGVVTSLSEADIAVRVLRQWRSPETRAIYPAGWEIAIPRLNISLVVKPRLEAQEWHQLIRYWEGSVLLNGTRNAHPVGGTGYAELTGY